MIPIITSSKKTLYHAFGLRLASDIPLQELTQEESQDASVDVHIEAASDLMAEWNHSAPHSNYFSVINGRFFFCIPNAALFCVQDGCRITYTPMPGADLNFIRLYLLGTCMGAILIQRGVLPLHGSAVVIDDRAYAIVGDKGAGKSTLAATFRSKGFTLLTDDVIAVSLTEDAKYPIVTPAYPQQKLWHESLDHLNMDSKMYNPLYQEVNKFAIPIQGEFCRKRVPLAGVFELMKADIPTKDMQRVEGLQRIPILQYHTYRNYLIPLLGLEQWHFQMVAGILNHTGIYQLKRPSVGFTAHELADEILNTARKGA